MSHPATGPFQIMKFMENYIIFIIILILLKILSFSIFQTRIATPEHVPPIPATGATAAWMPKDAGQILGIPICSPDVLQGRPLLVGTKSSD
jgi:hypothetical protein